MTWGVCLEYTPIEQFRRVWGYVVQEMEVPKAWERNTGTGEDYRLWKPTWEFNVAIEDLPGELIVLTAHDATHLKGQISLYDFVHPENATYFFGSDKADLRHRDLKGRDYQTVYIPDGGYMHSFSAAAIVVYDRRSKEWQSQTTGLSSTTPTR